MSDNLEKPVVIVKPRNYSPTKEEREEVVRIDTTPEHLAAVAPRPMTVIEEDLE